MTETSPHILVVDDDPRLRELLSQYLKEHGFRVTVAENAEHARGRLDGLQFDLLILDVMMPGETGFELTHSLRHTNDVPILLLTAKGESEDRIAGLELGADDYLTKPFEPKELLLRIKNILSRGGGSKRKARPLEEVEFGDFMFDFDREELTQNGRIINLTTGELDLLKVLAAAPGTIFSRDELMKRLNLEGESRTIDVQMTRLRRKIEENPKFPRHLQTVRNKGYVLKV